MNNRERIARNLSMCCMGLGQIYNRQYTKGALLLAGQASFIFFLVTRFFADVKGLITLGDVPLHMERIDGVRKTVGDHSIFLLIWGVMSFVILGLFAGLYIVNMRDARYNGRLQDRGKRPANIWGSARYVLNNRFPQLMLTIPLIGVAVFTIMPIVFMIVIAFTNFSSPNYLPPKNLVNWVGFQTFANMANLEPLRKTFLGVLTWTVVWAILSTFTTYVGGILVALLVQHKAVRLKKMWRLLFIIPYAIPQFVSLLMMRQLFNEQFGPINQYLSFLGLGKLPWLNDPTMAKVTVIVVNMWVGIPVSMLLVMGILSAIPKDLYEAAEVDGASAFRKFKNITMPYVLFATTPLLIMAFAGNINNFNVIYLLTMGSPPNANYQWAGSTDLLVTWLYKLTLEHNKYNLASAVGIILFLIVAAFSLWNYRRSRSFREEDMIQ
ncbi:carbohydrate ABC transporter permease [Cohnella faecalis]|uniref:carbohydrate ABC transporter permease n=1 Tax=Cohnella faecalis TaxID=2315694 RepID=UPI00362360DA